MDPWLQIVSESAHDLAVTALECEIVVEEGGEYATTRETLGCAIALEATGLHLQIGLTSDWIGCQALAQTLIGEAAELPTNDVLDALGEMTNIVAGGVKKRVALKYPAIRVGLPSVIKGSLKPVGNQTLARARVRFGAISANLMVAYEPVQPC